MIRYILNFIALFAFFSLSFSAEIYYLDNGMEVALVEYHASPVIASSIVVRTGLRDEAPDIFGASHFLEHLLFNGTIHRTQEELYQEMDLLGGYNNAHTGENFTHFVILTSRENFEKGLEIQADMLFNSILPDDKFEKERGIVREEIGQSHDRADYFADIHFAQRFFRGTPYSQQVLSTSLSLEKMKRSRVMDYYRSHYVPNNMTAIITGDFPPQEIKPLIEKYLGAITPGELPTREHLHLDLPSEPGIADITYQQEKTKSVYLRVGLPAPARIHQDYFTAEILQGLIEKRLNEAFTTGDKPLAQEFSLEYFSDRDLGAFILRAQLESETPLQQVLDTFRNTFKDVSQRPPGADEIKNMVIARKCNSIFDSERPHFSAMMKAPLLAFHNYDFLLHYYDNMLKVSPQKVKELAGKLYFEAPFIPVAIVPYPETEAAISDSSRMKIYRETLPNGLELMISPGSGSGVFAAHFLFKNRSLNEPPGKTGISNFLHNLLLKGTVKLSESQLQDRMNSLGMRVETADNPWIPFDDYRTTPEFSFVRMETVNDYWKDALFLTAEIVQEPNFSPEAIEATRGMLTGVIAKDSESASAKAKCLFLQKTLGKNALALSVNCDMRTLSSITREDLIEYHKRYFAPDNIILTITADPPAEEIATWVKSLFGKTPASGIKPPLSSPSSSEPGEYREKLGKKQSYICLGYLIESLPDSDRTALTVANTILNDRIQFQLREKQGLAYSLGSAVHIDEGWGYLIVTMGTSPANIDQALQGIKEQMNLAIRDGFKQKELTKATNSYVGERNMRLLTSINRSAYAGIYTMKGLPPDTEQKLLEAIKAVSLDEVNRCAEKYFKLDDLVIVVVE